VVQDLCGIPIDYKNADFVKEIRSRPLRSTAILGMSDAPTPRTTTATNGRPKAEGDSDRARRVLRTSRMVNTRYTEGDRLRCRHALPELSHRFGAWRRHLVVFPVQPPITSTV
jgi:hypothetical protein